MTRQSLTKTFSVDFYSEIDNKRYTGEFTIKKMSIRDLAALGVRKSQLNGGMYFDSNNPGRGVDEGTDDLNAMIAQLEISVKKAPAWWDLDNLADNMLIGQVYKEVLTFESSFLNRNATRASDSGSGEGRSEGSVSETNTSGGHGPVVESKVPASLEP